MDTLLRNSSCEACDLGLTCKTVCIMPEVQNNVKLMFILEAPSASDDEKGKMLTNQRDVLIERVMEQLGASPADYYVTYVSKCFSGKKDLTAQEVHTCMGLFLDEEVRRVDPKVIVTLGAFAMEAVTGVTGITKMRGEMLTAMFNDKAYMTIPTFNTVTTGYNDHSLECFARDIEKAYMTAVGAKKTAKDTKVILCDTEELAYQAIDYCLQTKVCCFDFETTAIDKKVGLYADPNFKPTMLSLSFQVGSAYTIPLFHFETPFTALQVKNILLKVSRLLWSNPDILKIAHNAKFDMHVINILGLPPLRGRVADTMTMHHLLDETVMHGLKDIVGNMFPEFKGYEDEVKQHKWEAVPLSVLSPYAGADTDRTLAVFTHFEAALLAIPELYTIFRNLTTPAMMALFRAECNGMLLDKEFLQENIKKTEIYIEEVFAELNAHPKVKKFLAWKAGDLKAAAISALNAKIEELDALIEAEKEKVSREVEHSIEVLNRELVDIEGCLLEELDTKILKSLESEKSKKLKKLDILNNHKFTVPLKLASPREKTFKKLSEIQTGKTVLYEGLNYGSPKQLDELLYTPRGFNFRKPKDQNGKEGGTGESILKDLGDITGFVPKLLVYRQLSKTLSTYMIGIGNLADQDNLVHTSFLLHGTTTGRLASREPNMQNIPRGSSLSDERAIEAVGSIKKMFVARPGYYLLQVDFSQMELRLAAFYANETTMLTAYNNGEDLHTLTAISASKMTKEEFFALPKEEQKAKRTGAKAGNFGLLYGMGATGFQNYAKDNYGVVYTPAEAIAYRNAFFDTYSKLLKWHANYRMKAKEKGYVTTLFGRRRHLTNIYSTNQFKQAEDERAAINSPIQGTGGEFTIFAISLLQHRLPKEVELVNTVHDSIIYQIPLEMKGQVEGTIRNTCENLPIEQYFGVSLKGKVSMKVDLEYSLTNWKDLTPIE